MEFLVTASIFVLQPPNQYTPGTFTLGVKLPGREANNSTPSSAKDKNHGPVSPLPKYVFMAW
jgi:hypothetical protein